jgi:hypothetical protein
MRRVVGVLIAVAALAGAAASQRGVDDSRRTEAREAATVAAAVAGKRTEEALRSFLRGEETRALAAAALPQVRTILALLSRERLDAVAGTLADSFQSEPEWRSYRQAYPVYAISAEGQDVDLVMGAGKTSLSAPAVVRAARDKGVGSGLVAGGGKLYAAAAAPITVPGRTTPAVILLAKPVDDSMVKDLSGSAGAGLLLVDGKTRAALAGAGTDAELATLTMAAAGGGQTTFATPSGDAGAMALAVAPGFTLWAHADAGVTARAAASAARTTRIGIWSVGGLIALVALFYGLRPGARAAAAEAAPASTVTGTRVGSPPAPLVEAGTPGPGPAPMPGTSVMGAPPSAYSHTEIAGRAPPARTPVAGGFGRYTLLDRLGEGGMSQVYTAVVFGAEGFRRRFVIKRLRPELLNDPAVVAQFIDEANMASSLVHSNIVPVLDFGKVNDEYFLATEYILGRDLGRVTRQCFEQTGAGMPLPASLFAAYETLRALEYAHTRTGDGGRPLGIVHRDVSPNNVLVSSRGEVKLFDFGIVKAEGRVTRTEHGVVKGNVSFMSPEQARGLAVDPRADIFSLGLVLFYCLTGDVLYSGTTSYELLLKAATGPGPEEQARIRALPAPANALVARALAVDPGQRFATAAEFAAAVLPHVGQGAAQLAALMHQSFGEEFRWEEERFASAVPAAANPAPAGAPAPGGSRTGGARRS